MASFKKPLQLAAVVTLFVMSSVKLCHAADPGSTLPYIEAVNRLGVDSKGNLWTWSSETGRVTLYFESGEEESVLLDGVVELDADGRAGVVFLTADEQLVEVHPWQNEEGYRVSLPFRARGIAWLDSATILVAPSREAHVLAKIDMPSGAMTMRMGVIPPIEDRFGAFFVRSVMIEPDPERGIVHALESLSGTYWKFELEDGELLATRKLENPNREQFQHWIAPLDDAAVQGGRTQSIGIQWFRLGLDSSGQPWTLRECSEGQGYQMAHLVRLSPRFESRRLAVDCCALNMTLWRDQLLMVQVPGKERCFEMKEVNP